MEVTNVIIVCLAIDALYHSLHVVLLISSVDVLKGKKKKETLL